MKNSNYLLPLLLLSGMLLTTNLYADCETDCDANIDTTQFTLLNTKINILEDQVKELQVLSRSTANGLHDFIDITEAKKQNMSEFKVILNEHFLANRIKLPLATTGKTDRLYEEQLRLIHKLTLLSTQSQRDIESAYPVAMRKLLKEFAETYEQYKRA